MLVKKACWISWMVIGASLGVATARTRHDQVTVNLPFRVTVGDKVLEPGEYRIRQVNDNLVQIIRNASGAGQTRVEAPVVQVINEFNDPAKETKVILHRFGDDYYFDKMSLQGKGYGYLFIQPESLKARERERRESPALSGKYEQVSG